MPTDIENQSFNANFGNFAKLSQSFVLPVAAPGIGSKPMNHCCPP